VSGIAGDETDPQVILARKVLFVAALLIALGLAIAGSVSQVGGGIVVLAGWLGSIYGLHRFGRTGTDSGNSEKTNEEHGTGTGPEN
jgi:hypothetical protein